MKTITAHIVARGDEGYLWTLALKPQTAKQLMLRTWPNHPELPKDQGYQLTEVRILEAAELERMKNKITALQLYVKNVAGQRPFTPEEQALFDHAADNC